MKKNLLIATLLTSALLFCIPAHAESQTGIEQYELQLTINGDIRDNNITLTSPTEHTHIKSYTSNPDNTVEVYVEAENGYHFDMTKASQVTLSGANYLKASRKDQTKTLYLKLSKDTGGYWVDDENGRRFRLPDGSYWDVEGWFYPEKAYFYVSGNDGYILTNCQTPDGYRVDSNGKWTDTVSANSDDVNIERAEKIREIEYQNVVDDTLKFMYNGELAETPCKIYYKNYRRGTYTTVKQESAYIQEWDGESPKLTLNYSVEKDGGYTSTYLNCYVFSNDEEIAFLGGSGGLLSILFDKTSISFSIPTYDITPGDLVEIYLNG